jgi:hypothetical protein
MDKTVVDLVVAETVVLGVILPEVEVPVVPAVHLLILRYIISPQIQEVVVVVVLLEQLRLMAVMPVEVRAERLLFMKPHPPLRSL